MNSTRGALALIAALSASFVVAGVFAGCGNSNNGGGADQGVSDLSFRPDDLAKKVDMACVSTGTGPVGSACATAKDCSGCNTTCSKSLMGFNPPLDAPAGYCSNTCKKDTDCGEGGYCQTMLKYCLQPCVGKGDCAQNAANHCFQITQTEAACIPVPTDCDPTSPLACENGAKGACFRLGGALDDVGNCQPTCPFGGTCDPDASGNPQNCYFLNLKIDGQGMTTGDYYAGLVCLVDASMGGGQENSACMYLNSCAAGLECDFYGDKKCHKLCRLGLNDCAMGQVCSNTFKLGVFGNGDIGLCE